MYLADIESRRFGGGWGTWAPVVFWPQPSGSLCNGNGSRGISNVDAAPQVTGEPRMRAPEPTAGEARGLRPGCPGASAPLDIWRGLENQKARSPPLVPGDRADLGPSDSVVGLAAEL